MRTPRSGVVIAVLIFGAILSSSARSEEGSGSIVGDIKLPSGPMVVYDYHFDHNAFADSVDLPGGLIALTASGNLIRFDPETRKSTREWFGPSRVTCICKGGVNSALIGLEDGRIARLDPTTLAFTVVATLPGRPHWVGTKAGDRGVVAVIERWKWVDATEDGFGQLGFRGIREFDGEIFSRKTGNQQWSPYSEAHDLATGQSCAIDGRASTVFLDRKDRVWFGFERGEFGGWCHCVALTADRASVVRGPFDPPDARWPLNDCINGFAELRDGRVLALGGVMHELGSLNIYRVDGERLERLVSLEGHLRLDGKNNDVNRFGPGKPDSTIVRMTEEPGGSLLALGQDDNKIYRTDSKLDRWDLVHDFNKESELESYALSGTIGELSSAIRAIHFRDGGLLCATAGDGYILVVGGKETRGSVPDQLAVLTIGEIENTPKETLYRDSIAQIPWRLEKGQWSIADDVKIRRGHGTFSTADGASWSVELSQGRRAGNRGDVLADKAVPKGRLLRYLDDRFSDVAEIPGMVEKEYERTEYLENGELLHRAWGEERRMKRRDGNGFPLQGPARGIFWLGDTLRVVNPAGPPWAIFDREEEQLFGLAYGLGFQDPKFAPIPIEEGGLPLKVYDAASWSGEDILIATRKGLKLCSIATGKHRPAPLPSPDRPVRRLARDGSGRLWLGGEGLWMVDPAGRLHDFAGVPMVGRSKVAALARDADREDGVIVSIGERGVAFIRAEPGP